VEIVISDLTGANMTIDWREPRRAPLQPSSAYERRVVEARRRRLVYPYEIIRMLTGHGRGPGAEGGAGIPTGRFEEHDLDPEAPAPRARSVSGRPYGANTCSVVFGLIETPTRKVREGMRRVLLLSDPTRGMGSLAGPECDRIVAAIDLAESLGVPLEWVPVSSGARIAMDSGTENLDATARVVRRIVEFTQAGGVIHAIVTGVNVGAQSYWDALSTMLMHTRGALIMTPGASMVLTGRAALEASGAVAAEDELGIGGYERVMGPNGEAQYFASDLAEAYRILYEHYDFTYVVPGEAGPRRLASRDPRERRVGDTPCDSEGFTTVGEIFDDEANPGRKRPFAMREVMEAVVDADGGHLERWRAWAGAETAIVWDAHLGGWPVCLIGMESRSLPREGYRPVDGPASWTGGTLFPLSSKKVSRALHAASGNRPAVVLANLSGFDGSPESMRKLQLEYGAEIARAVVNFRGPILFLVVSRYHGGAYVVFSRALHPRLRAAALEGSYASVIGGGPAAAVVFGREARARAAADPRVAALRGRAHQSDEARGVYERVRAEVVLEKQAELAAEFDAVHTVERARSVGSLEALVSPARMRAWLVERLDEEMTGPRGTSGLPS
jgi:acetyl-CoA carboxylase carboxyltransferase component